MDSYTPHPRSARPPASPTRRVWRAPVTTPLRAATTPRHDTWEDEWEDDLALAPTMILPALDISYAPTMVMPALDITTLQTTTLPAIPAISLGAPRRAGARGGRMARATLLVMLATLLASALGFVREALIARDFGASAATDAYVTAFFIPNVLQSFLISGSLTVIFIPILAEYIQARDERETWRVISLVGNLIALLIAALTVAGFVFTPALVSLYAPLLSPATRELTVSLTRILFLSIMGFALSSYFVAVLNTFRVFGLPALTTALFNGALIAILALVGTRFGVTGLTWATFAAAWLQVLVSLIPLLRLRPRYSFFLSFRHPAAKRLARLALPQFGSVLFAQVYFLVERVMASGLSDGSISALNYANKLWIVPANLLGNSLLTVIYPRLSEHAASGDHPALVAAMVKAFRQLLVILVPISALFVTLATPITQLVFERGAFGAHDTLLTSGCLAYASLGIFPAASVWLCTRVLFALKDAKAPLLLSLALTLPYVGLNALCAHWLQASGLALCYSLTSVASTLGMLVAIRRHTRALDLPRLLEAFWKVGLASAGLALVAAATLRALGSLPSPASPTLAAALDLLVAGAAGALVYGALLTLLRMPEAAAALAAGRRLVIARTRTLLPARA